MMSGASFRVEFYVGTGEMPARYPRARGCLTRLTRDHGPSSPHEGRRRRRHRRCVPGRRLVAAADRTIVYLKLLPGLVGDNRALDERSIAEGTRSATR